MKFKTASGFITVIVGTKKVKVNTRDQRLSEDEFPGYVETIEGKTACLCINNRSEVFARAAEIVGRINDGPKPPDGLPRMLRFARLSVRFPDDKTKPITRPNHPLVFNLLQYTEVIEAPAITVLARLNDETAAWFGRVLLQPYEPPIEEPALQELQPQSPPTTETAEILPEIRKENYNGFLFKPWQDLQASARLENLLVQEGYGFIFEIVVKTQDEWCEVSGFGKKALQELKELLAEHGLQLGMNFKERELTAFKTFVFSQFFQPDPLP